MTGMTHPGAPAEPGRRSLAAAGGAPDDGAAPIAGGRGRHTALGVLLARRIAFFAILAMILQLVVVFAHYYGDDGELPRLFVEEETERLAAGVGLDGSSLLFDLPAALAARYGHDSAGYAARLRTADGAVLYSTCDDECEEHFLPLDLRPPTFWLRMLKAGRPLSLAGGRTFTIAGTDVLVEVVTLDDPADVVSDLLLDEVIDHMIVPMGLLLVLVLGATLLSVHQALVPVRTAAIAADAIDPLDARSRLPTRDMPAEIAHLAEAVNRAFGRVGDLMRSQRELTTGIAHEVRTPLAAIKLELGRIDHPRARKAEADVDELAAFVQQMTALARLESFDHAAYARINLAVLATDFVEAFAPHVYARGHSLALEVVEPSFVMAIEVLIRDVLRNLVENATKHGRGSRAITVRVEERAIVVEDGPAAEGAGEAAAQRSDGLGIGLRIVARVAALHGAGFTHGPVGSGYRARFAFPGPDGRA